MRVSARLVIQVKTLRSAYLNDQSFYVLMHNITLMYKIHHTVLYKMLNEIASEIDDLKIKLIKRRSNELVRATPYGIKMF